MSKSTRQLVIVGNAFERERRAAQAAPKRVMWTRDELADLLNVYGRMVAAENRKSCRLVPIINRIIAPHTRRHHAAINVQ